MNSKKKIFPIILLFSSILLFIYVFYKSEIFFDGSRRDYYLIYYLLSLTLIFFSIIINFINKKIKEYLVILGISLIVSFYFFEGYLNISNQFLKKKIYENLSKKNGTKEQSLKFIKI